MGERPTMRELVYGTLQVAESPTFRHQNLLLELAVLMRVCECWLVHQLSGEIEVITLGDYGPVSRRTFREVTPIESAVLPRFRLSPAVLACW